MILWNFGMIKWCSSFTFSSTSVRLRFFSVMLCHFDWCIVIGNVCAISQHSSLHIDVITHNNNTIRIYTVIHWLTVRQFLCEWNPIGDEPIHASNDNHVHHFVPNTNYFFCKLWIVPNSFQYRPTTNITYTHLLFFFLLLHAFKIWKANNVQHKFASCEWKRTKYYRKGLVHLWCESRMKKKYNLNLSFVHF